MPPVTEPATPITAAAKMVRVMSMRDSIFRALLRMFPLLLGQCAGRAAFAREPGVSIIHELAAVDRNPRPIAERRGRREERRAREANHFPLECERRHFPMVSKVAAEISRHPARPQQ